MVPNLYDIRPWYREPWPWLLMAGPAAVMVAGIVTAWLAVRSDDGLVQDDYYKSGLAINKTLYRDQVATLRGYRAELQFFGGGRLRVSLAGNAGTASPGALRLRIMHPTRAGADRVVALEEMSAGRYEGLLGALGTGRWLLVLEDPVGNWRLTGEWRRPGDKISLVADPPR